MARNQFFIELSENIRSARKAYGLTQVELAQMIGVTASCVSMYESGRRIPNIQTLAIMCDMMGRSVDDLLPEVKYEIPQIEEQTSIFDEIGE